MHLFFLSILLLFYSLTLSAQQAFPLYQGVIPNNKEINNVEKIEINNGILIIKNITNPSIEVYLPSSKLNTKAAVIIFPGGGYWVNAYEHEGKSVAKAFQQKGIAAFVVKYRLPDSAFMYNPSIAPLQDAQQAMLWVKQKCSEYKIDSNKIGVLGFSAGGHLASLAATKYREPVVANTNNVLLRPAFAILIYPVISFVASYSHASIASKLLGQHASDSLLNRFSPEQLVDAQSPPAYLVHAADDDGVLVENSISFFEKLHQYKIPAALQIIPKGGHGFGFEPKGYSKNFMINNCIVWLKQHKIIN